MVEVQSKSEAILQIEHVGGIDRTTAECPPGITILTGRNATNRTSFLQAIMAVLGSDNATLKADAEEGSVELSLDGKTYTRTLTRTGETVHMDGDPYLDDPALADLFAFLLESNPARRAVATSGDLREIIMEPVDTAAIEADIDRLQAERDDIQNELDDLEALGQRLPRLEERRVDLESRIEATREELAAKEAEIDDLNVDLEDTREEKAELEDTLEELREIRGNLETTRDRIDSETESIEALEEERREIQAALDELSAVSPERIQSIGEEMQRLRGRVRAIEATISDLQPIIQFNEETLEEGRPDLLEEFQETADRGSITDELVTDTEEIVCWTCGSAVEAEQIESMLDQLRAVYQQKSDARASLREKIDDLANQREKLQSQRDRREELESRRQRIDEEVDEREARLEDLEEDRERLTEAVDRLEEEVQALRSENHSEVLDLHTEANELEFELDSLESDLADVEEEIGNIEARLEERGQLEAQRDEIQSEIESLKTRIEDLERAAVEEFNEHMDSVLELLDYANLERIWIERVEREVREGRRRVSRGEFDLHVVRSTSDGTVYEDTVEHLSESEREVTGLVFGLAGYLAHEVYEDVPFMLLDSVEAIDSGRIAALVEYLEEFADYLVVALLPEDAAALDEDFNHITDL